MPIGELDVGDLVLAWDQSLDSTDFYTVTAVWAHLDTTLLTLTIDGEQIETTPEHPFYIADNTWVAAGELWLGARVKKADGGYGTVSAISVVDSPQVMYNLTVSTAHTYYVGEDRWLVHNACDPYTGPIYRGGSDSSTNLTPRPGKDDTPGGGLSFFNNLDKLRGRYVEVGPNKFEKLKAVVDNDKTGHVSVSPETLEELKEWAGTRGSGKVHPLTEELRNAVVGKGRKGKKRRK